MHYLSRTPKAEVHWGFALARPPAIRLLLVIQEPHASDKRSVALLACPIDGFQGGEDVVCVVFCGNRHMRVMFEPPPPTRTASAQGHVMDKSDVAEALHEYEEAMTEFLTSVRARDTLADFPLRQRLYAAGIQIERLKLRGTPAYNDAVLRADLNSWPR
jgi:hypothetical protein